MNTSLTRFALSLSIWLVAACGDAPDSDSYVYTLYRNTPSNPAFRVHVATFDSKAYASGGEADELMNKRNCELVLDFLQREPDASEMKFWCEKRHYRR